MPTINQLIKGARKTVKQKSKAPSLDRCPQKRGVCVKVYVVDPKSPNSANRKVCRVRLTNGKMITAYIPGEDHTLTEHNQVLVRGGGAKDVPGSRYTVVRGALDCTGASPKGAEDPNSPKNPRRKSRSKYGVKKIR